VRCFEDVNIIHVSGSVDALRDIEVISLELILADYAQVEKRLQKAAKDKKTAPEELSALNTLIKVLDEGTPARKAGLSNEELAKIQGLGLLSLKPVIYAANVMDSELATGNDLVKAVEAHAKEEGASVVTVSAQVEAELVDLEAEERAGFLEELGVTNGETGLQKLIREVYSLLQLQTYYTSGDTESRAWTIKKGMLATQAAGVIHTDFERGFIKAETVAYDDLIAAGDYKTAKEAGKVRQEGKDYVVKDADVMLFKFNV